MYEALEHWKEYQKQKQKNKIVKTIAFLNITIIYNLINIYYAK